MSETTGASSSASSSKLNSSTNKRTLSDAGLDDPTESDHHNNGKRVVVFEAFKLFDVQSAVRISFFFLFIDGRFPKRHKKKFSSDFRKNSMPNSSLFKIRNFRHVFKIVEKQKSNGNRKSIN